MALLPGGGSNSSGDNSGGSGGDNSGGDNFSDTSKTRCEVQGACLTLGDERRSFVEVKDKTVTIEAGFTSENIDDPDTLTKGKGLAFNLRPNASPNDLGFDDAEQVYAVFNIEYPGANATAIFVSRTRVTRDTIALRAINTCNNSSETEDNDLAASPEGGHCRKYSPNPGTSLIFNSYLGTVFNNINTDTHARGMLKCSVYVKKPQGDGTEFVRLDENTVPGNSFYPSPSTVCSIAVVNNGDENADDSTPEGARLKTLATKMIDDNWVDDLGSTTKVELYAIGFDMGSKTIADFSGAATLDEFNQASGKDAFQKLLKRNNTWRDLKFTVEIVKSK